MKMLANLFMKKKPLMGKIMEIKKTTKMAKVAKVYKAKKPKMYSYAG